MTSEQFRMLAARNIISLASSLVLELLRFPIFFVVPTTMPPLPGYEKLRHAGCYVSNLTYGHVFEISLFIVIIAAVIRLAVVCVSRRKSRIIDMTAKAPEKPIGRAALERQDSAACCQKHWENDHKEHLDSLQQEILQHTEEPIHPWILPPERLPGPYDPMYYPLPPPTIRPTSTDSSPSKPETRNSAPYTRLVSTTGSPPNERTLYGTITTSTRGWRRTHWNVTGG